MILGFGSTVQKTYPGTTFELLSSTLDKALEMAHLDRGKIDGLIATFLPGTFDGNLALHFYTGQLAQYLGIRPRFLDYVDFGGASALAMLYRAEKAISAGDADNVVIIVGGKASPVRERKVTADSVDRAYQGIRLTPFDEVFRVYDDLNPVTDYALVATRHSHLFGTTDEQRASIAVKQRFNAQGNPKAMYKDPLRLEDVLSSRMVSTPLRLLEIVYPVDGFHVFVVGKSGGKSDLRPLSVKYFGEAHWPEMPPELPDIVSTPAVESSKGARPLLEKMDCFELYDSFTITVLLQIEDIGLAEKGKGGRFAQDVNFTYQGEIPINTGGGSLNVGQPAYMSGGVILEEALIQLNAMGEGRQVKGVDMVLVNGIGGWNRAHSTTLVLGE
ncbi:Acetyl-CoA acetyltransferase-like protein [Metallosphaera sedula]|uniref:Acetyl-CoA acetyltransferase-like protein n=3 Tax=Metallosphaera TaxID=41980 RepID=A4YFH4_METS5|nr:MULTISPECIES: thiolase family protein [Metallosphaera]ABP95176.1 Acetyl-CoA acetyltransferase-like protein [Metallosphaera sedula DSM 5348]AIM27162.1 Acetyl-CoA acetyltransferase-like protein [Metallosphaera sedula]AKV74064.1 acetyl-CoA acetyltransferase [Metallosphaera sedula]AKV76304.1 acetyl-CoA acetyltransferase [Metallosphaera sedula]AKV78555.1 acetyl-CoA acetyltransferase [Metallosphaera sedula]